jgi:predicted outer membrane repeat protein
MFSKGLDAAPSRGRIAERSGASALALATRPRERYTGCTAPIPPERATREGITMRACALAIGLTLCLATAVPASTIVVDLGGGGDYTAIREAVEAAASHDTVLVRPGTYTGPLNRDITFAGKTIVLVSESGAAGTVIDCQHEGRAFEFSGNENPGATVEGFTVKNGSAVELGGAFWMEGSSPSIIDCVFRDNTSGFGGGAFHIGLGAAPYIEYCVFEDNAANDYGGAIYTYGSMPYVLECDFRGNTAGINGGAISAKTGTVATVLESRFEENSAADGGAIYVGTVLPENPEEWNDTYIGFSRFEGNIAERGGALFLNSFSYVSTQWCTFIRNSAELGGGIFGQTDNEGDLSVQNCTLVFNHAEFGGGICAAGSSFSNQLEVTQTIIAFSTAGNAVHRLDYSPVITDLSLAYGNEGGDALFGSRVLMDDPLFCDVYSDDYNLCENSPARADNNQWGFLMGSCRQYCPPCSSPVDEVSWGTIKAMFR